MARRSIFRELYAINLTVTILSLVAVAWYASGLLRDFFIDQMRESLTNSALLMRNEARRIFQEGAADSGVCSELDNAELRFTLITAAGKVVCDTAYDPEKMANHLDRPEVREAIFGDGVGFSRRYSATLGSPLLYVAIQISDSSGVLGVARLARSQEYIDSSIRSVRYKIALGGLFVALAAAILFYFVAARIKNPLNELKEGVERFANGDLNHVLRRSVYDEIDGLSLTMNEMAVMLDDRISAVVRRRNELEAVLSSMVEGVIAVDSQKHLININISAARMFDIDPVEARRKKVDDFIENPLLLDFIDRVLDSDQPLKQEMAITAESDSVLRVQGSQIKDSRENSFGAMLVFGDITELRRLENVRRDFVANVSHELKTPITSIKAAIETLYDGATENVDDARQFMKIIMRHSDRLEAIIEDLLSLSRIEVDSERGRIALEESTLVDVLSEAVALCESKRSGKQVAVEIKCDPALSAMINPPLIEQAVMNLVDNAIRYSEVGAKVIVEAFHSKSKTVIAVRDNGLGIPPKHLSRIFERFYCVDKARSRKLGGTGLGLAIVKHIMGAHEGGVEVESKPGEGSTFYLKFPTAGA